MKLIREIILSAASLIIIIAAIGFFSETVLPYRDGYGCLWRQYRLEDKDSIDIMFFGSSLAYAGIIPAIIYEETGYTSYVMAGPQLTVKQTYYYIKEALRTQSPKLIFLETTASFFSEYTDYSRINIGYMPYTKNRVYAAFLAVERAERVGIIFPPYNYNNRYADFFDPEKKEEFGKIYVCDPLAGYMFLKETVAQDKNKDRSLTDYSPSVYNDNIKILEKTALMCEKAGIELVFYQSPMYKPLSGQYYDMIKNDASKIGAYYDFNAVKDEICLDMEEDFYDIFHLNYKGAEKFTRFITGAIKSYNIERAKCNEEIWQRRLLYYAERLASD